MVPNSAEIRRWRPISSVYLCPHATQSAAISPGFTESLICALIPKPSAPTPTTLKDRIRVVRDLLGRLVEARTTGTQDHLGMPFVALATVDQTFLRLHRIAHLHFLPFPTQELYPTHADGLGTGKYPQNRPFPHNATQPGNSSTGAQGTFRQNAQNCSSAYQCPNCFAQGSQ